MEIKINNPRLLLFLLPLVFSTGCAVSVKKGEEADISSQLVVDPTDLAILSQISAVASSEKITVNGMTYVLGEPYYAASGRRCRSIVSTTLLNNAYSKRVVCKKEMHWFFIEDIFGEGK